MLGPVGKKVVRPVMHVSLDAIIVISSSVDDGAQTTLEKFEIATLTWMPHCRETKDHAESEQSYVSL